MKYTLMLMAGLAAAAPALAENPETMNAARDRYMQEVDTDKDGKVSKAEFSARGDRMFGEADTDTDGYITSSEGKAAFEARRAKWKAYHSGAQAKDKPASAE